MKKVILFLAISCMVISCSENDNKSSDNELVGTWIIIENYQDPGDGSGTFHPVENNKFLKFKNDGTVTSNGSLCYLNNDPSSSGTYSISDSTITSSECADFEVSANFELNNSVLTVYYFCIEGCGEKYVKVN